MSECSICLEGCESKNVYCKTKCNHCFHYLCLEEWGLKSPCPLCRDDVDSNDLEIFKMDIDGLNKKLSLFERFKMKTKGTRRKIKKGARVLRKVFFGSVPSCIGTLSLGVGVGSLIVLSVGIFPGTVCFLVFGASMASAIFYLCGGIANQMIDGTF